MTELCVMTERTERHPAAPHDGAAAEDHEGGARKAP
jgi:hypothetical protein